MDKKLIWAVIGIVLILLIGNQTGLFSSVNDHVSTPNFHTGDPLGEGLFSVSDGSCTPDSGYNYCWRWENTNSEYGLTVRSEVEIHTVGRYYGDGHLEYDYKFETTDESYRYDDIVTDSLMDSRCSSSGCNFETISETGTITTGDCFVGTRSVIGQDEDKKTDGEEDGAYVTSWVAGSVGTTITEEFIRQVAPSCFECAEDWECTGWSSCNGGTQTRTCTEKAGCDIDSTKPPEEQQCDECVIGAEKCEGTTHFICEDTSPTCNPGDYCIQINLPDIWVNKGEVEGKCGVSLICENEYDLNCDDEIDRTELTQVLLRWLDNDFDRETLGDLIQQWSN